MDKDLIAQAAGTFMKIENKEREIERLRKELGAQVTRLTDKETDEYVKETSKIEGAE